VWLYQRTSSRIGGRGMGRLPLLLTVPGRRSGTPHTVPVAYLDHNGGYLLVGTGMGGTRAVPQWFLNLQAAGTGHIQIRRMEHDVGAPHQRRRARGIVVPDRRLRTAPRQVAGADGTRVPGRSAEPQAQRLMTQRWQSAPRLRPGHEGAGRRCAGPPATATSAPSGTDELADAVRPYSSGPPPCRTWSDEPWPPPTRSARYRSEAWLSGNHGSSGDPAAACRGCARRRGRRPFATC
jgi:deazaflavin-dependent oxidoreductase (nitroreductase family)